MDWGCSHFLWGLFFFHWKGLTNSHLSVLSALLFSFPVCWGHSSFFFNLTLFYLKCFLLLYWYPYSAPVGRSAQVALKLKKLNWTKRGCYTFASSCLFYTFGSLFLYQRLLCEIAYYAFAALTTISTQCIPSSTELAC